MKNFIILLILVLCIGKARSSESRIQVAILDTGVSYAQATSRKICKNGRISLVNDSGIDRNGHGTNIFGIIAKKINPKTHCIVSYKIYSDIKKSGTVKLTTKAINMAVKRNVRAINISMSGGRHSRKELNAVKKAVSKGIYVIVAAGNDGLDLDKTCTAYLACYGKTLKHSKFRVVTTMSLKSSNRGSVITDIALGRRVEGGGRTMSGTSQATAVVTSTIINKLN